VLGWNLNEGRVSRAGVQLLIKLCGTFVLIQDTFGTFVLNQDTFGTFVLNEGSRGALLQGKKIVNLVFT